LPILVRRLAVGVIPATAIPKRFLRWIVFVTQILSQHKLSSILSQHEVRYPCAIERLVDASPFFLFLDSSLFEFVFTHPFTMS